jgi:hypothetical protein
MHTAGAQRMYSHTHTRARLDACVHQPVKQVGQGREKRPRRRVGRLVVFAALIGAIETEQRASASVA